jgi:hypothetical protein
MFTEQSVSTCTGPYHLEMFLISIMALIGFLQIQLLPKALRGWASFIE